MGDNAYYLYRTSTPSDLYKSIQGTKEFSHSIKKQKNNPKTLPNILLPGSIFCILTLLCWKSSVNHSRSCNLASCWRQSKKRGKWVPLSSGWASSEMLTSSEMMARAANCAKYDFTKGMSTSSLGHWSNTFRKALKKVCSSQFIRP